MNKFWKAAAGIAAIVAIFGAWFEFASYPPYATAGEVRVASVIAKEAKVRAIRNERNAVLRLLWQQQDRVTDGKGGTMRLREFQQQIDDLNRELKRVQK